MVRKQWESDEGAVREQWRMKEQRESDERAAKKESERVKKKQGKCATWGQNPINLNLFNKAAQPLQSTRFHTDTLQPFLFSQGAITFALIEKQVVILKLLITWLETDWSFRFISH